MSSFCCRLLQNLKFFVIMDQISNAWGHIWTIIFTEKKRAGLHISITLLTPNPVTLLWISKPGYPFVNILCDPKPASAATLQANHWRPLPRPKQVEKNHFRQGSQAGSLVLAMVGWCMESFLMNISNVSTACPNSRKPTHLISGDTDNAEGLVVILCCDEEWSRRIYYR